MKLISKNLLIFSGILFFLTVVFRYFLSSMLQNHLFNEAWMLSIIYGIIVFISGWIFGKKDKWHLPLYDIGFRFHLATYLICNSLAEIWHIAGFQSQYEKIKVVHITAIVWGIFLLIHFILYLLTRKNAIEGIKKTEIFE